MPRAVPLSPSVPNYRVGTTLDGIPYIFDVRWNSRGAMWFIDILDIDEDPIASGLAAVLGTVLGIRVTDPRMPPGDLILTDTSGEDRDAGFDDLGDRVVLLYYDEGEA